MPFTIRTNRGGEKLADDSNHVSIGEEVIFRTGNVNDAKLSVTIIIEEVNEHNHLSNPTKPAVYACLA